MVLFSRFDFELKSLLYLYFPKVFLLSHVHFPQEVNLFHACNTLCTIHVPLGEEIWWLDLFDSKCMGLASRLKAKKHTFFETRFLNRTIDNSSTRDLEEFPLSSRTWNRKARHHIIINPIRLGIHYNGCTFWIRIFF